jgi:predicted TIM-barrel fold metal-dependent hydrolase
MDLSDLPIVDGHCHPLLADPWTVTADALLDLLTEGRPGTMRPHVPHTGYHRRVIAALARRFGVEPTVDAVLARRARAGAESAPPMLREARIESLLVDTGYPPTAMPIDAMRGLLPCAVHEVLRIERCAERLLARAAPYEAFLRAFEEELVAGAARGVAFKTIVAYRAGLAVTSWPPSAVRAAYASAVARAGGGAVRLTEKPLLDTLVLTTLDVARRTGRPVQVHSGFGDPDIDLPLANPALLRPVLEGPAGEGVAIVLLHMAYPYHREAAFMTAVWPQVHLDLSLALPFLGPGVVGPLVEVLALAPASKLMYGSDLSALPELFALAAAWGRAALGEALEALVARGDASTAEARAMAAMILAGNARALYRLPAA